MELDAIQNSPVLWVFVIAVFAIVIIQALIFTRISRKASTEVGLDRSDVTKAVRTGAISAIGPSLAIAFVAIGLIAIFGAPATLMRIGLVGSVPYELAAAGIASSTLGVELGGEGFDGTAWATVFLTMALGAGVWMLFVILFTKSMGTISEKAKRWNPLVMAVVPIAAMVGAFGYFGLNQVRGGGIPLVVFLSSAVTMGLLLAIAHWTKKSWIKEWALGISMAVGIAVAAALV